jgi:hypothetical protein
MAQDFKSKAHVCFMFHENLLCIIGLHTVVLKIADEQAVTAIKKVSCIGSLF